MAHIGHDSLDIESIANKIFCHFLGSSKDTEELKAVFSFVKEDYQVVWRHTHKVVKCMAHCQEVIQQLDSY